MKKIMMLLPLVALGLAQPAYAVVLGTDITISDENYTTALWHKNQEDQEVEPGMQHGQIWDMEGFFQNGNQLTMVGGYNFVTGQSGFASGDLFIDIDGDATYGDIHGSSNGNLQVANSYGYDFVFDMDFNTLTYALYALSPTSEVLTAYYLQNQGSSPWRYVVDAGDVALATGTIDFGTLTDAESGFVGGTHYYAGVDLSALGSGLDYIAHWTMQCGNDNLMGEGEVTVPEPGVLLLMLAGLMGLVGRRVRK